ncbi:MAG: hypothetical protein P1V20_08700 [Verrucomicrobiales bacterium]|nr:hypothetical protein [Verrucomicrobiales bacterium]
MKCKLLSVVLFSIGYFDSATAEEITSENGDKLKEFYTRFPKSDANKNGILTLDEMYNYLDKKIKDGATSELKGKKFVSRIYLKEILEKTPASDLNQDGILTKEELLQFVKSQKEAAERKTSVAEA